MKQQILAPGEGKNYHWSKDHVYVKTSLDYSDGRVTVVEDTLKPGFHLPRHFHKVMTEVFYILEGELEFIFDDETVVATAGTTVNIPPMVMHEALCKSGAKMLTIFSPGGFDTYLEALDSMTEAQLNDEAYVLSVGEKYDTWMAK